MKKTLISYIKLCIKIIVKLCNLVIWETSTLISYDFIKKRKRTEMCIKVQKHFLNSIHKDFQIVYNEYN